MCQGYCMVVFENECKKTNTRSQTQKYLSLGKFTLAPLCEPHKIEIVQEKRQVTFIAIVVGRHESMPCLLAHNYQNEGRESPRFQPWDERPTTTRGG